MYKDIFKPLLGTSLKAAEVWVKFLISVLKSWARILVANINNFILEIVD